MRITLRLLLAAPLALHALPSGAQQPVVAPAASSTPTRAALVARLDSLARDFLTEAPSSGATVAVVRGSDTLLLEGVGQRNREQVLPATPSTVYRVGSITKQFTAAAIMQLVEQGKLSLADHVTKYLPQYPQWAGITIAQLLNHTSGIHSYTADASWRKSWASDLSPAEVVAFVEKDTLDFAPGTRWRYNNTGYMLLGMVLEKVTGEPYASYVSKTLFAPAGMSSAGYCPSRATSDADAAGYDQRNGSFSPTQYLSMTHPWAAGALCMSVPDFLRWQAAFTSGRVVSPATYAQMSTSDTLNSGVKTGYGFALWGGQLGTHRLIHHGGDVNGFSAQQLWLPDDSLRVVVFSNTSGSNPDWLARNLASAVLGLPLQKKVKLPPAVALSAADRAKYEGTYALVPPTSTTVLPLRVWAKDDGLSAQVQQPGQGEFPLRYLGNDTFGTPIDPTIRIMMVVEGGRAVKARLQQGGATLEGPRQQ
jgi:CubicO group peptidase (beta-lactamase class C family)